MGILSLLLFTPLFAVLVLSMVPREKTYQIRILANVFAVLALLISCWLIFVYDHTNGALQLTEQFLLNPKLGTSFALGIDGLSLPMIFMATLLTSVCLLASFSISTHIKSYYISVLVLELGMLGVFLAQDWSLYYIFWELTLTPVFLLIGRWGGAGRHMASINFVLYTMGGSIFMLISLLAISQYVPDHGGTLMSTMTIAAQSMPRDEQLFVLIGFLIGFGVKIPIFPLHGWLPLAHVECPSPISILMSGILLKMGAYGLIRAVTMLPEVTLILQPFLVTLALVGMIYGGLLAWRQSDLKAMVAYSSVSHMGIVLLGIATLNEAGMTGAVIQMTAHGLIAGGMFLLVGLLYERTHTRNILDYSSLIQVMPRFTFFMTVTFLAAMGLPGTVGFIAELHTFVGGYQQWGNLIIFLEVSILISSAYAMRTISMLFTGPVKSHMREIEDLKLFEWMAAAMLVIAIVVLGIWPTPLIELSSSTISLISETISEHIR